MATNDYADLEARVLADLATKTVMDPSAPHEHVEAARRRLVAPRVSLDRAYESTIAALDGPDEFSTWWHLERKRQGDTSQAHHRKLVAIPSYGLICRHCHAINYHPLGDVADAPPAAPSDTPRAERA